MKVLGQSQETPASEPAPSGDAVVAVPGESYASAEVNWAEWWKEDFPERDYLLEPVLLRGRGHSLLASAKDGKTELTMAMGVAIVTGHPYLHQPARPGEPVLVVDKEMTDSDLREMLTDLGIGPDDDLSNLHYALGPAAPMLDTAKGGAELLARAQAIGASLVVIDTLSRVIGGSEQDAETLQNFYRYTGHPLKVAGIAWLRLDHLGKDKSRGGRGTSAKADDVDIEWRMTRTEGGTRLHAAYSRKSWVPEHVDLARTDEPVAYKLTAKTWPQGTQAAADLLDAAGVPLGASRRTAEPMLKTRGHALRTETLGAALRWRREQAQMPGNHPGNHPFPPSGNHDGNHAERNALTSGNQSGNHAEPPAPAYGNQGPPLEGGPGTAHPATGAMPPRSRHEMERIIAALDLDPDDPDFGAKVARGDR